MTMECLVKFSVTPPAANAAFLKLSSSSQVNIIFSSGRRKIIRLKAKLQDQDDPLLQAAVSNASLRFQETNRPEPLVVDQYAACLVPPGTQLGIKNQVHPYGLATKFIDDTLLAKMKSTDELRQVVLLTDGMDTRPYRINWPRSTIIFDISPKRIFDIAAQKLQEVGAKIPRSCLFVHLPSDSSNLQENLRRKGFNGNRPSIWVFQGLPVMTLASFEEILGVVSSLAVKGCLLQGELPRWLADTEFGSKSDERRWMEKLFMSHGFRVEEIDYNRVAGESSQTLELGNYESTLFVAEHLRFSDDQMEIWRREFHRIEEDGDEEGFEEL